MAQHKILALLLLISITSYTGLQVNRTSLMEVLRNYSLLGRVLLANFVVVPVLGIALVHAFRLTDHIATGILLMAIAPGVPFLGIAAGRTKGGSVGLAVSLMMILQFLAIFTVPATAQFVLPVHDAVQVPFGRLIGVLLAVQLLPLLAGMIVRERWPKVALRLERPFMIVALLCVVILLVLLSPAIARALATVYGSYAILAILVLLVLSLAVGWVLGGPTRPDRFTLSVGTALRNIGLAALIATSMFPDTDVAATVMTYFLLQVLVTSMFGAYSKRLVQRSEVVAS